MHLFSTKASRNGWADRIAAVLCISVAACNSLSPYACKMCIRRIEFLEKAADDLSAFRELAQHSYEAQLNGVAQSLKRTRGDTAISPETVIQKPSSKLARRRLFTCW